MDLSKFQNTLWDILIRGDGYKVRSNTFISNFHCFHLVGSLLDYTNVKLSCNCIEHYDNL